MPSGVPTRLKLVKVANQKVLLLRMVGSSEYVRVDLHHKIEELVPAAALNFDGEIYRIRGGDAIQGIIPFIKAYCSAIYDPNLLDVDLKALRNPWPIDEVPLRGRDDKPIVYMARVWHQDMAESLAFQLLKYHDDFIIEFRRRLKASSWRQYRRDLKVWVVADHYEPLVHDVLDRFFDCRWDEFLAGDEWNILPPPRNTQYRIRTLDEQDFRILGAPPGSSLWEIHAAYREQKEKYVNNNLHPDEWYDVDTAFQRITKYYKPPQDDDDLLPHQVTAPTAIVLLLRKVFSKEEDRVLWYYRYQDSLRKAPADLASTEEGIDQVLRALELMLLIKSEAH